MYCTIYEHLYSVPYPSQTTVCSHHLIIYHMYYLLYGTPSSLEYEYIHRLYIMVHTIAIQRSKLNQTLVV
jgi:hypothetical protein